MSPERRRPSMELGHKTSCDGTGVVQKTYQLVVAQLFS